MRTTQIERRRIAIEEQMDLLREKLVALQAECKHRKVVKEPRSDTGNWCKADDSYWYHCECPCCGKVWSEEQ